MSHCACFTLPDGTVGIMRPNPVLVLALLAPTVEDAMVFLDVNKQGLTAAVVTPLYRAMAARTELEAIRVIAERDTPRVALVRGLLPTDVADLAVTEATGLLAPTAPRRWRNCWRRVGMAPPAVDMSLARVQRMAEIRADRDRRLAASDGPMIRAQETGTPPAIVAMKAYRQALRDVPQTMDLDGLATPEALAAFEAAWPVEPV